MNIASIAKAPPFLKRIRREWSDAEKAVAAKTVGEAVSIVAGGTTSLVVGNTLLRHPYGSFEQWAAKHWVEPFLPEWNGFLAGFPTIDTPADRKERACLAKEQEARKITSKLLDVFGVSIIAGLVGQFYGNRMGYKLMNISSEVGGISKAEERLIFATDVAATLGGIFVLNKFLPEKTNEIQKKIQNVLEGWGLSKDDAENRASWAITKQVPNALAFILSTWMAYRFMKD